MASARENERDGTRSGPTQMEKIGPRRSVRTAPPSAAMSTLPMTDRMKIVRTHLRSPRASASLYAGQSGVVARAMITGGRKNNRCATE